MKKIYLLLGLVSCQSFSQDSQKSTQAYNEISFKATDVSLNETIEPKVMLKKNGIYVKGYLNNIPSAVMFDFLRKYESVENINWKVDDDEIFGNFYWQNQKIAVTYNKNGQLVSTRKTYDGSNINKSLLSIIQPELNKGFTVSLITEVVSETVTLYEVNMIKQQQISVVRLSKSKDGEPEVTERFAYSKISPESL